MLIPVSAPAAVATPAHGVVQRIVDGDTVALAGGTQVRLVGIQAPKLALGRSGFKPWPLAEDAKAALGALVLGRQVGLSYGGRRIDRHRRLLAHLSMAGPGGKQDLWVQAEMLKRGLARVYTFPDNRARAAAMLEHKRAARAARRGIWSRRFYRILSHDQTRYFVDTFQLVEGIVLDAAIVRRRGYLNFGADWRSDFTISIAPQDMARFRRAGIAPGTLTGRTVRVRGWLRWRNGPMIDATHPEQLEVLD